LASGSRIRLTRHAREKFDLIKHYGLEIDEKKVFETIQNPARVDGKNVQYFAIRAIDTKYALRVVYEKRLFTSYHFLSGEARAIWHIRSSMMWKQTFSWS